MTEQDADRFATLLGAIAERYDKTISPARIALDFRQLRRFDWETVAAAYDRYCESPQAKFGIPQPINIIEIVEGSEEEREIHAWNSLNNAIRRIGNYMSLVVEDWAFAQAVLVVFGSWNAAVLFWGEANEVIWAQKRRDFLGAYKIARRSLMPGEQKEPTVLAGKFMLDGYGGHAPRDDWFGVLRLNGEIESRKLEVDSATLLPAAKLADVIALPAPKMVPLLPAGSQETEPQREITNPEEARRVLQAAFDSVIATKAMPDAKPKPTPFYLTPEEEERRKAFIRQQAADGEKDLRASTAVRGQKKRGRKRRAYRTSDDGSASAKA